MVLDRREVLNSVGVAATVTLSGCVLGSKSGPTDGVGTGDPDSLISAYDTTPLFAHSNRPSWDEDGVVGHVVVIGSEDRMRAAIDRYDLSAERRAAIREFTSGLDYSRERLLFVESVGPNACYDRLEIGDVGVGDGGVRATASVSDTSVGDVACAEVLTYSAALLRVTFESEPIDTAAVDITNGWGETGTVRAEVGDSIGPRSDSRGGYVHP